MANNWKLSPSELTFLWEECRRCFYLKVRHGIDQPRIPMPKVFIKIDGLMKSHFNGKPARAIDPSLPTGTVSHGERWVKSAPIKLLGLGLTGIALPPRQV
jgi:hypothetical protein